MQDVAVRRAAQGVEFRLEQHAVGAVRGRHPGGEEVERRARLRDAQRRVVELHRVKAHRVAHDTAHPPAGQGVVADEGNAAGGQPAGAEGEDFFLYRIGDPGIDAVRDDVIELAERLIMKYDPKARKHVAYKETKLK